MEDFDFAKIERDIWRLYVAFAVYVTLVLLIT